MVLPVSLFWASGDANDAASSGLHLHCFNIRLPCSTCVGPIPLKRWAKDEMMKPPTTTRGGQPGSVEQQLRHEADRIAAAAGVWRLRCWINLRWRNFPRKKCPDATNVKLQFKLADCVSFFFGRLRFHPLAPPWIILEMLWTKVPRPQRIWKRSQVTWKRTFRSLDSRVPSTLVWKRVALPPDSGNYGQFILLHLVGEMWRLVSRQSLTAAIAPSIDDLGVF